MRAHVTGSSVWLALVSLLLFRLQDRSVECVPRSLVTSSTTTASASEPLQDRPYKGRLIGKLQRSKRDDGISFVITGTVFAVDDQLLYIDKFTYDGAIPDMYIWGLSSDPRSPFREEVFIIPTSKDCLAAPSCTALPAIWEENLLIALPRNISLLTVTEIAIGTRNPEVIYPELQEKYASAVIPSGFVAPNPHVLPTSLGHIITTAGTSSGRITIQDSRRILLERVTFDGTGPDAYFWVDRSPQPTLSGYKVSPNNDEVPPQPLTRLPNENQTHYDALLDLRRAFRPITGNVRSLTIFEIKSVAIYDRNHGIVYGDAPFNGSALKGVIPPALDDLTVQRISDKAANLIRDLNYRIGLDNEIQSVHAFPQSSLSSSRIPLTLSSEMQNDRPARHLRSDWHRLAEFKPHSSAVLPSRLLRNIWNCEKLDGVLQVEWKIQGTDVVTITLTAPLTALPDRASSYIAFGLSGSDTGSEMIGSDVTMGYLSPSGIVLTDLILGGRAKCDKDSPKLDAVCPRALLHGKQASKLFGGGGLKDGKMSFTFRRPIAKQDFLGKDIPLDMPVFVVWAIGPMNQTSQLPEYHTAHTTIPAMLDFGRIAHNNCEPPVRPAANTTDGPTEGSQQALLEEPVTPVSNTNTSDVSSTDSPFIPMNWTMT